MSDCLDDSYDIPSVPRFAILGASDEENDVNKTLGDRFFDFPHLQTNTIGKEANEERIIKDHADFHSVNGSAKQPNKGDTKKAKKEVVDNDDPLHINELAMFRPPSRSRMSRECASRGSFIQNSAKNSNAISNGAPKAAEDRKSQKGPSCVNSRRSLFGNSRYRSQSGTRIASVDVKPKVNTFLLSRMRSVSCESHQAKKQTFNHVIGVNERSSYIGPETRARSKLKTESTNASNPQKSIRVTNNFKSTTNERKFTPGQLNGSQFKGAKSASNIKHPQANTQKLRNDNLAATGHISRPRSRIGSGPVRVNPIAGSLMKCKDKSSAVVAELETETEFRQSIRSRMKGGASMERQSSVTRVGCSKGEPKKREFVNKPIEFAPCMRTRAIAVKVAKLAGEVTPSKPGGDNDNIKSKKSPNAAPKRRTATDREAFFRRLSTPKFIASGKKTVN